MKYPLIKLSTLKVRFSRGSFYTLDFFLNSPKTKKKIWILKTLFFKTVLLTYSTKMEENISLIKGDLKTLKICHIINAPYGLESKQKGKIFGCLCLKEPSPMIRINFWWAEYRILCFLLCIIFTIFNSSILLMIWGKFKNFKCAITIGHRHF